MPFLFPMLWYLLVSKEVSLHWVVPVMMKLSCWEVLSVDSSSSTPSHLGSSLEYPPSSSHCLSANGDIMDLCPKYLGSWKDKFETLLQVVVVGN